MSNLHWLASFPKSGNTWVRMLVNHYDDGRQNIAARHDDVTRYWFQVASPVPVDELTLGEQMMVRPAAIAHMQCFLGRPTLVKTHHAAMKVNGVPLFTSQWAQSAVYVVRDPRDIVASFQSHMGLETLDDAIEMMGQQQASISNERMMTHLLGSWSFHAESWIDAKFCEPLVVRYEDMQEDTARELTRIIEHVGLEVDPERIENAVELCRFDRLKEREQEQPFPEASPNQEDGFFRKGKVGGFREELSPEQIARVEEEHGEMMQRLGYEPVTAAVAA